MLDETFKLNVVSRLSAIETGIKGIKETIGDIPDIKTTAEKAEQRSGTNRWLIWVLLLGMFTLITGSYLMRI